MLGFIVYLFNTLSHTFPVATQSHLFHLANPKASQVDQNTNLCHSSRFLATETHTSNLILQKFKKENYSWGTDTTTVTSRTRPSATSVCSLQLLEYEDVCGLKLIEYDFSACQQLVNFPDSPLHFSVSPSLAGALPLVSRFAKKRRIANEAQTTSVGNLAGERLPRLTTK
jgi:hypothetical protein